MKYVYIFLCLIIISCGIDELILPVDARERYENSLGEIDLATWKKISIEALNDCVLIDLPYKELIDIDTISTVAAGYIVHIQNESVLNIELNSTTVIIDIHKFKTDS